MGVVLALLVLATGGYGLWLSIFAKKFTERDRFTGRAKYQYTPRRYERILYFVVSAGFSIAAIATLIRLWKSN